MALTKARRSNPNRTRPVGIVLNPGILSETAGHQLKAEPVIRALNCQRLDCRNLKDKPRYAATLSWYAAAAQNAVCLGCKSWFYIHSGRKSRV